MAFQACLQVLGQDEAAFDCHVNLRFIGNHPHWRAQHGMNLWKKYSHST